jgi:hypothetical protein
MSKDAISRTLVQQELFDYGELAAPDVKKCEAAVARIKKCQRRMMVDIIAIGSELNDVKQLLEHGQFGDWIDCYFGWSWKTADRMMKASQAFGELDKLSNLTIDTSALYLLSSDSCPDDVRDEFLERAEQGEHITHAKVKERLDGPDGKPHVAHNSGENEWYTPPEYIAAAVKVMGGIDTDPASSELANQTVGAATFYTADDDGLKQQWTGNVWMNPPYSQPAVTLFCDLLVEKWLSREFTQACVLVNNATETSWFQGMLCEASCACFVKSRVKFLDPDGNPGAPLQGQTILYFGKRHKAFADVFAEFGTCMRGVE